MRTAKLVTAASLAVLVLVLALSGCVPTPTADSIPGSYVLEHDGRRAVMVVDPGGTCSFSGMPESALQTHGHSQINWEDLATSRTCTWELQDAVVVRFETDTGLRGLGKWWPAEQQGRRTLYVSFGDPDLGVKAVFVARER